MLTLATLLALALAALLAYTTVLKDAVVMAEVTAASGDLDFTPTLQGRRVDDTTDSTSESHADRGAGNDATPEDSSGDSNAGKDNGPGSSDGDGDGAVGPGGGPDSGDAPAPRAGTATIDGFTFSSASNMTPGETVKGEITLRNTGEQVTDVRLDVSGSDPFDCFSYTATPSQRDASGAWVAAGSVVNGISPAIARSEALGSWAPGQEYRTQVALTMDVDCTVGSGLSSKGSTALADRHPDHATARLNFQYVPAGSGA